MQDAAAETAGQHWERTRTRTHIDTHTLNTYMRGRRRIGAVGGLLRGRRLPVRGHLALATRVRVHGSWCDGRWRAVGGGRWAVGGWRLAGVASWVTGVECVRGGGRPTTWCCHAVMNRWNTTERVRAASVASRRTLGAVAVAVAVAVAARSVVWWCGRSSGAGEVSQILAARFEAAAGQQWAVQTASRERASGDSQANRRGQQDRRAACGGRRATGNRPALVLDAEAEAEADARRRSRAGVGEGVGGTAGTGRAGWQG